MRGRRHGQRHDHRAALSDPQNGRLPAAVPFTEAYDKAYDAFSCSLRGYLETVAESRPDVRILEAMTLSLTEWSRQLAECEVEERERPYGRRKRLPGRGQATIPMLVVLEQDHDSVTCGVRFGSWFLGGNGAAHGGAVPLLFDEVMGMLAHSGGRSAARTAYLHVDYRAIVPIGRDLDLRVWVDREEGRKRFLKGRLSHGDLLCAEAEALLLALLPGQP